MVDVEEGVRRITFPLPLGIDHVHCYLLRSSSGGWILVDTSLGARDPEAQWRPVLDALDAPVERIVVTHLHPDHVGGARDLNELTGAPVHQGREDYAQCVAAWGSRDPARFADYWARHGMPGPALEGVARESERLRAAVHWYEGPELLDAGDEIDGWRVHAMPGHADGHLCLYRDGVLIAGDSILAPITPAVGLYAESRPDPLGDYLGSLTDIAELDPRVSYGGHGATVDDPAERAHAIVAHHDERLDQTQTALDARARSGYEISHVVFGRELPPIQRRFAVAETLSHLERLVVLGRAARSEDDRIVTYTAPQPGGRETA